MCNKDACPCAETPDLDDSWAQYHKDLHDMQKEERLAKMERKLDKIQTLLRKILKDPSLKLDDEE
jgi:hypothetical protein